MARRLLIPIAAAAAALVLTAGGAPAYPGCTPGPDLRFRAADGTKLVGHRFGTGKTFVVLAHQYDGDTCEWAPYAKRLASLGYSAIAFDLRGFGLSQKRTGELLYRYDSDVAAAAKLARSLGAKRVYLVGASVGANAVLVAGAAITPPVNGVVSLSAPSTFRLDAVSSAKQLTSPVLYVAATHDGTYRDEAQTMLKETASTSKSLVLVPTAEHGVELVSHPGKVRTAVESFLRR